MGTKSYRHCQCIGSTGPLDILQVMRSPVLQYDKEILIAANIHACVGRNWSCIEQKHVFRRVGERVEYVISVVDENLTTYNSGYIFDQYNIYPG